MYRFLLTRRWVGLTLAVIALCVVMAALGRWQWHRHEDRSARNTATRAAMRAAPGPVGELLAIDTPVPKERVYRSATAAGRFDPAHELLVRRRSFGGNIGYYVLTPLVMDSGAAVLVNRGWVASAGSALARPQVPAPPSGPVTVTGRVRASEPAIDERGVPEGQVARISAPKIAAQLPYPVFDGYLDLTGQQPPAGEFPRGLPAPELSDGPHVAYAVQWYLFVALAIGGWVVLVRQEARDPGAAARRRVPAERSPG